MLTARTHFWSKVATYLECREYVLLQGCHCCLKIKFLENNKFKKKPEKFLHVELKTWGTLPPFLIFN